MLDSVILILLIICFDFPRRVLLSP